MTDTSELRRRVREHRSFSDSVAAFFQLVRMPDLTWLDLLDGVDCPGLIAENAVIRLHRVLNVPVPPTGFIMERDFWVQILSDRGMHAGDLVNATREHD
jgi:hypothetical protein